MDNLIIILISIVAVILHAIAILVIILYIQRRRQRALMLAIAQEQARSRQRKRKKTGLHRWEIDLACPQALVSDVSSSTSSIRLFSSDAHPDQYTAAINHLSEKELIPNPRAYPPEQATSTEKQLATPVPLVLEDSPHESELPSLTSKLPSKTADHIPKHVLRLPKDMNTCIICLDEINLGARVRSLPCHHVYHAQCIRVWLRRKNACPCCCVKVIKRRKKRERSAEGLVPETDSPPQPILEPTEVQPSSSTSGHDVLLTVVDRVEDRGEHTVLEFGQPLSKRMSLSDDRPGVPSVVVKPAFPRNGSLLDPDDGGSEIILASEASSHLDESSAAELLIQVRKALRGEGSMISLNEESKSDANDDSFRPTARDLDLGPTKRPGILAADVNRD